MMNNNIINLNKMNMNDIIKITNNSIVKKKVYNSLRINCSTILLTKDNKVILGTRIDFPQHILDQFIKENKEFKWTNASGGLERGESPINCAARELQEEFNVKVGRDTTKLKILNYTDNYYTYNNKIEQRRDFIFITYLKEDIKIDSLIPQEKEIGRIEAFSKDEIMEMIYQNKIYGSTKNSLLMIIKKKYI